MKRGARTLLHHAVLARHLALVDFIPGLELLVVVLVDADVVQQGELGLQLWDMTGNAFRARVQLVVARANALDHNATSKRLSSGR